MGLLDLADVAWRAALYGLAVYLANRLLGGFLLQAAGPSHARAAHLGVYGLAAVGYGLWWSRSLGRPALAWTAAFAAVGLLLGR